MKELVEKISEIRQEHPKLGKYKLKIFINEDSKEIRAKGISVSSIGLIIKKQKMFYQYKIDRESKSKREVVERVRHSPKEKDEGYIISDTVTVVVKEEGIKRYFYNAIDVATRFAFSLYYRELDSRNMVDFMKSLREYIPTK